jgi:hypothetical protein
MAYEERRLKFVHSDDNRPVTEGLAVSGDGKAARDDDRPVKDGIAVSGDGLAARDDGMADRDDGIAARGANGMVACGDNWGAYVSNVDIAAVFDAMQTNQPLGPELVKQWAVVLVRHETNSYQAYTTEVSRIPDLPHSVSVSYT